MQAFHILDVKPFMQLLFQSEVLDSYHFISGEIHMDINYSINGLLNSSFYTEEELDRFQLNDATCLPWSLARDKVFQLIRGKKTPIFMKIVLRLPYPDTEELISKNHSFTPNDIDGMFLNITFQGQKLNVICGISYKIFSMDKDLESLLSEKFTTFLQSNKIAFEN